MTVEVLRSFDDHAAGDIVDASGWLWTEQLIQQRYVRPVYDVVRLTAPVNVVFETGDDDDEGVAYMADPERNELEIDVYETGDDDMVNPVVPKKRGARRRQESAEVQYGV